jgi:tRNA threonylcarbamoyladenosine biosynthesis protein TsaE
MQKYTIKTLSDTKKLAAKLAGELKGSKVIGLTGNLGAGKTTFTQFLAAALGVKQTVNSPTFNIIKVYSVVSLRGVPSCSGRRGNLAVHGIASPTARNDKKIKNFIHIDAYRLASPAELMALGVEEYFNDKQTVTIIEWADKVKSILPAGALIINIKLNRKNFREFKLTIKK